MRIAFLILTAYESAGTEHAVITQANGLADRHDVEIISVLQTRAEPHFRVDPRVTLTPLARDVDGEPASVTGSSAIDPEVAERLRRGDSRLVPKSWDPTFTALCDPALEEHLPGVRADVVVTVTPALLAVATQLLPQGVRVVHQEHRASAQRSSGMTALLTFAPRADLVAVLTDGSREWLEHELGDGGPPVVTVPNAIPPGHRPRSLVDQPLIVSAGRLVAEKRFDHLIEAFAQVAEQLPGWRLRIFGSGPQRQQLLTLAEQLGLYDRLELPGVSSDMTSQWGQASICALTSRGPEGLPLVLQEALAAGVPVVSYDCPSGPRDLVQHDTNGILVPSGSIEGMAQGLLALACDDERRRTMGAAALASSARYDATAIRARWEELYASVVEDAAGGRATRSQLRRSGTDPVPSPSTGAGLLTPTEARADALRLATAAARRAANDWFVLPGRDRDLATVVLPAARRGAFLEALVAGEDHGRLRLRDPGHEGWHERTGSVPELGEALRRDATPRVVLEPWPEDGGAATPVAYRCGVEIAFWTESAGSLVAPVPGGIDRVGVAEQQVVRTTIDGVEVDTVAAALTPRVDDVMGAVDVVLEADGADELLRHQLRSVHYHAPWVRRIHLRSPLGRGPSWVDPDHPVLRVVPAAVPLPELADLAERLLVLPPSVLLVRPVRPELFFCGAGSVRVPVSAEATGALDGAAGRPALEAVAERVRRDLGRDPVPTVAGTLQPLTSMAMGEAHARWPDATDAELVQLSQQLALVSGHAVTASARGVAVPAGISAAKALRALPSLDVDTVSLETLDGARLPQRLREVLTETLDVMTPRAAQWEV